MDPVILILMVWMRDMISALSQQLPGLLTIDSNFVFQIANPSIKMTLLLLKYQPCTLVLIDNEKPN